MAFPRSAPGATILLHTFLLQCNLFTSFRNCDALFPWSDNDGCGICLFVSEYEWCTVFHEIIGGVTYLCQNICCTAFHDLLRDVVLNLRGTVYICNDDERHSLFICFTPFGVTVADPRGGGGTTGAPLKLDQLRFFSSFFFYQNAWK